MKKTHLLLAVIAIFITGLFNSSTAQYAQWNFGVEGGPSATATIGNDAVDLDTKPDFGFLAGMFGQYNINRNYSIKMAANYQIKTSEIAVNNQNQFGDYYSIDGKIHIDMITIPVLFRANFGDYVKFFVNAGPYLGIVLRNEVILDPNTTYGTPGQTIDNTDSTKGTEFGVTAGLGLQIPLSTSMGLTFEFRDDIGLTNLSDYTPTLTSGTVKTNAASILLGLTFNAGRKYSTKK